MIAVTATHRQRARETGPSGLSARSRQGAQALAEGLGTEDLATLAEVVESIGSTFFFDRLSGFVAQRIGTSLRLVIRYSSYGPPIFEVNGFMSADTVQLYLEGLWRIDPLNRLSRSLRRPQVVRLRAQTHLGAGDQGYLEEVFKLAFIFDELAILLPVPGGGTVALCCDRQEAVFSDTDQLAAEAMLPLVAALHRRHLAEVVLKATRGGGTLDSALGPDRAVSILDPEGQTIYASRAWDRLAGEDPQLAVSIAAARQYGEMQLILPDDGIVHWESLELPMAEIPHGAIAMIEVNAPGPIRTDMKVAAGRFCQRRGLTPRETDIVHLILLGFANSEIAKRLSLSPGTVKNHRWRLYYKLDITTEREMFIEFLRDVLVP